MLILGAVDGKGKGKGNFGSLTPLCIYIYIYIYIDVTNTIGYEMEELNNSRIGSDGTKRVAIQKWELNFWNLATNINGSDFRF